MRKKKLKDAKGGPHDTSIQDLGEEFIRVSYSRKDQQEGEDQRPLGPPAPSTTCTTTPNSDERLCSSGGGTHGPKAGTAQNPLSNHESKGARAKMKEEEARHPRTKEEGRRRGMGEGLLPRPAKHKAAALLPRTHITYLPKRKERAQREMYPWEEEEEGEAERLLLVKEKEKELM